jgi:hypothetical protein
MDRESGSALIIVLIIMAVILSLTIYVIKLSKEIVQDEQGILEKLYLKLEARSLYEKIKYIGSVSEFSGASIKNSTPLHDFPEELLLTGEAFKIGNGTISLYDTAGKINALYMDRVTVRRLFQQEGIKQNEADIAFESYEDWKDSDGLKHLNGAEKYFYRFDNDFNYEPRNNIALQDDEELRNIKGFLRNYDSIKKYLTFAYRGSLLNINTAPSEILSAMLDISEDEAKQVVLLRKTKKEITIGDLEELLGRSFSPFYELYSSYPSLILEIKIEMKNKLAGEKLQALVDFKFTEDYPYTVIKYVE